MTEKGNSTPASGTNRPPQTVFGGFLLHRRDSKTGELIVHGRRPFEHGSREEAEAHAKVMAERHGAEFALFQQVASILPPAPPATGERRTITLPGGK